MKTNTKFWISVASKDHIANGIAGGFMQANHGKAGSIKRMRQGDWIIFYSPKQTYKGNEPLQAFTAIGQVADEEVYQGEMSADFKPFRRNVQFYECEETLIAPLIADLEFIPNKTSWGYPFRFGFFEINEHDFKLVKAIMLKHHPIEIYALNINLKAS